MEVKQALVTCGGTGSTLRKQGIEFPLSKSFIDVNGQPILYWCLMGLSLAGIENLIIVGDSENKLLAAEKVLADFPLPFSEVGWHEDPGLGTNGLPYHTRDLLEDRFFFEFGHNLSEPRHYQEMSEQAINEADVVVSLFRPIYFRCSPVIKIENHGLAIVSEPEDCNTDYFIGPPYLFTKKHADMLPKFNFEKQPFLNSYQQQGRLRVVVSAMPIEVDTIEEWQQTQPIYQEYSKHLALIPID
jgi:dTDP-glucose pyrophosphorylase